MLCEKCRSECTAETSLTIDDKQICRKCIHGNISPIKIWPIGVVKNDKERCESDFGTTGGEISRIELLPSMKQFMSGLADETHLIIIWNTNKCRSIATNFKRGWDSKEVGMFASRTPDRLTPIAITEVELLKIDGTTLTVRGLDAINETPVLDIKVGMKSLNR